MKTVNRKESSSFEIFPACCNPTSSVPVYHQLMNGWIILEIFYEEVLKGLPKWLICPIHKMAFILQRHSFSVDFPTLMDCCYFFLFALFAFSLSFDIKS